MRGARGATRLPALVSPGVAGTCEAKTTRFVLKLVFFFLEEDVEGGEGAVAFGDVLLELDLFAVGEFLVGVDLLFEDAEVVADHDDFVEEDFEGDFFGREGGVGGVEDDFAVVPAEAELFDDGFRRAEAELVDGGVHGLLDELLEWNFEAGERGVGVGGFEAGDVGFDGALGVGELDVGGELGNGFDGAEAVLRVADGHADVEGFKFHGRILTTKGHGCTRIKMEKTKRSIFNIQRRDFEGAPFRKLHVQTRMDTDFLANEKENPSMVSETPVLTPALSSEEREKRFRLL